MICENCAVHVSQSSDSRTTIRSIVRAGCWKLSSTNSTWIGSLIESAHQSGYFDLVRGPAVVCAGGPR